MSRDTHGKKKRTPPTGKRDSLHSFFGCGANGASTSRKSKSKKQRRGGMITTDAYVGSSSMTCMSSRGGGTNRVRGRVEEEEAISECGSLEQTGWRKALPAFGRGGKKAGKKGGRGYGTAPFVRGGPARKPYGVAKRPGKGKKFVKKGGSNSRKGSKKGRR